MTNNQLTKEWLQQTIAKLESVRDEIPFGIDTNSELELAAFKMALAAMDSEPVAYWRKALRADGFCYADGINSKRFHDKNPPFPLEDGDYWEIIPLYRHVQPAPVVPECHSMFDVVTSILDGIDRTELDDGWWETSAGAEFGREKLEEIRSCMIKKSADKSAFLQHVEKLATDAKELAEQVQRNDVKALTTSEEHRQLRDLVMMVKMLCRTVRKYNPESQQAANFTAYLQKEGLISAADCLRDSDPLDTESEDRRG
ncbi:hypothetical protein ACQ686_005052 [Klebsiella aerogenes]